MKLYHKGHGPPSIACRQFIKYIGLDCTMVEVEYGTHLDEEYGKLTPQKEIPVLEDNGLLISESNAILQYLADAYAKDDKVYPKDPRARAIVNQRLCFNLSTYYTNIVYYVVAPMFFDYPRSPLQLKKVKTGLDVFNTYLQRLGKKYVASDNLTIADFQFVNANMCLEVLKWDFSPWPYVAKWYSTFKKEHPDLWEMCVPALNEFIELEANPPDMSDFDHPIHPKKPTK